MILNHSKEFNIKTVIDSAGSRSDNPYRTYPERKNVGNIFYPFFEPKFKIEFTNKIIFTIGSCFAREIEENLSDLGCNVPTRHLVFEEEAVLDDIRPNFIINQYNPGCIGQRIESSLDCKTNECIYRTSTGEYIDLLLPKSDHVTLKRLYERKKVIDDTHYLINQAELVIITLGFTECWFDTKTNLFLNRPPPLENKTINDNRFLLKILDYNDCVKLLEPAIRKLTQRNIKVILTVSPVPQLATFLNRDCVISNELSKSTLRTVVEYFQCNYDLVDYYPSYEVVRLAGPDAYLDDNRHVKSEIVSNLTKNLIKYYSKD